MKAAIFAIGLAVALLFAVPARAAVYYVTVAGLGGEPEYEQEFTSLAMDLDKLLKSSGGDVHVFTLTGADATRAHLTDTLAQVAAEAKPDDDFVLTLIGHGSFDGVEYKFNLPGPDISAADLAALCDRVPAKRQLIVNTSSASGGSVAALERRGRAVITATKSGTEKNATVFARYWVQALHDPEADVDKNDAISALEAFRYATTRTAAFYDAQKRLATEHAEFEDTGLHDPVRDASTDTGEGLLLSSFTLIRLGAAQKAYADPAKRALLARKEDLERQIDTLKYQKAAMSQDDYKSQLTAALLELAKVQEELDK
ncbi:MAG TPA: hypothetical protein VHX36_15185 [Candidatus Acidoferrales bacterium]|jgi:hypothetical protein|nr:hypothetical protein [Candidatus Acidoferrales bacterium]